MKVAILPMDTRGGVTVCTWAMAMGMAYKQSKNVRVCFSGENPAIKRYIGKDETSQDKTRSISQVSKLLQAHAIAPEELSNYCIKVGPNLELMDSWSEVLTTDEMDEILTFVYARSVADFTICDLGYSWDDPVTQSILKASDVIVFLANASWSSLTRVKDALEHQKKLFGDATKLLLVNRYNDAIWPVKECARQAGFSMRDTCKLHYNPYIEKGCNGQDLQSVILHAFEYDPRVVQLRQDIKEITQFLLSLNAEKTHWED